MYDLTGLDYVVYSVAYRVQSRTLRRCSDRCHDLLAAERALCRTPTCLSVLHGLGWAGSRVLGNSAYLGGNSTFSIAAVLPEWIDSRSTTHDLSICSL